MAHIGTSGLQAHSVGDLYPWVIVGTQRSDTDRTTAWYAWHTETGDRYPVRDTYAQAELDAARYLSALATLAALDLDDEAGAHRYAEDAVNEAATLLY